MTQRVAAEIVEFAEFEEQRPRMLWIARLSKPISCAAAVTILGAGIATASGELAAIVEQVHAPSTKLQAMDFLTDGTEIRLRSGESLTISYVRSCLIEKIGAGEVRIGHDMSRVSKNARIERRFVECGVRRMYLTARQAGQSAGVVVRIPPLSDDAGSAALIVYSTAPLLVLPAGAENVVIERLGGSGRETHRIKAVAGRVDLLATQIRLTTGATYSAATKFGTTTFKVSSAAKETEPLLLRRLVPF